MIALVGNKTVTAQTPSDSTSKVPGRVILSPAVSFRPFSPFTNYNLPANFYSTHLPFFCDKELKMEKLSGIPFRFRLGSVDYVNKLEGKH
ncbi:hypothetical protein FLA_5547 [Filimonas lacunae]|nr:hypothetical protein FLA_5547 [Filimonas lacunae]